MKTLGFDLAVNLSCPCGASTQVPASKLGRDLWESGVLVSCKCGTVMTVKLRADVVPVDAKWIPYE